MLLKILLGSLTVFSPINSSQIEHLETTLTQLTTKVDLQKNEQASVVPQTTTQKQQKAHISPPKPLKKSTENKGQTGSPKKIKQKGSSGEVVTNPQPKRQEAPIEEKVEVKKADTNEHQLPYSIAHYNQLFLTKINKLRGNLGLKPVRTTQALVDAAMIRARENQQLKSISHTRPNGSKFSTAFNGRSSWIGENLTGIYIYNKGEDSTERAFQNWVHSQGHYEAMITPDAEEIGIGVAPSNALIDANGNMITKWPSEIWVLLLRQP